MYAPPETADEVDLPHELSRPLPPRTWRERVDDLAAAGAPPWRTALVAGLVAVVAVLGWRLMAPPPPPPEVEIPMAEQPVSSGADGATAESGEAAATAAAPGAVGAPAGGTPVAGTLGPGDTAAEGTGGAVAGGEVVVHVAGAVTAPGVQRLPAGARVVDAVDASGGATPDADLGRINLAAPLADGQQVYVLRQGETPPVPAAGVPPAAGGPGGRPPEGGSGAVDINTASATQLEELPGVGPATAAAIIAHREQNGPFSSVDDLLDVRGIGEAKLEALRDIATV